MESNDGALMLFGGTRGWNASDWTASDDRVRGGKSQSYLDCSEKTARFYGTLDIKTLGGAGFASQRTTGEERVWDLHKYAGISLDITKADKKRYTFILKDEILPPNPGNGREQAVISWECDFELTSSMSETFPDAQHNTKIFIPWASLTPTYRGKVKKDAKPLDRSKIRRISIMMRSYFGTQEGDFSLSIKSISALPQTPSPSTGITVLQTSDLQRSNISDAEQQRPPQSLRALLVKLTERPYSKYVLAGLTCATIVYVLVWKNAAARPHL